MSIDYVDKIVHIECDMKGCHANFECGSYNFTTTWHEAKEEGWACAVNYRGNISEWSHFCPKHAEEV
jgi:hypothetical protein